MAEMLQVSVCYATPTMEILRQFEVATGSTIGAALTQCGVLAELGLDLASCRVGIYAKKKPLDTVLRSQDRIEIYRPLVADPKDSRRRRAVKKQA
jgi:putative ubiquitin-RnfH superfamily antitoxin RatB of RatAB toxin-antitoxin module